MEFFSDTQEIAWRFGEYIDDLHDVFRCNDVDFGAPEDFFAFARTLRYHSELRGDVLRVVKAVMESGTNVSFRTILTVIAVASGGPEIATCQREMSVPVKSVIESLIGVGAWSQPNTDQSGAYTDVTVRGTEPLPAVETWRPGGNATGEAIAGTEENAVAAIVDAEESSSAGVEAMEYAGVSGHAEVGENSFEKVAVESSGDSFLASSIDEKQASSPGVLKGEGGGSSEGQVGSSSAPGESTLVESLTRLELNSLQLKVYLDSIDQRISRIEPRLEKVAPLVLSTPEGRAKEEPVPRFSAAIASANAELASAEESLPQHDDLSEGNEPDGAAIVSSAATGQVAVRAPTGADWRQFKLEHILSGRRQSLTIFVGVAILLLAASLFWWLGRYSALVTLPENASTERGANAAGAGGSTGIAPASPVAASQGTAPLVGGAQGMTVGENHGASAGQASAPVGGRQEESVAPGYGGQSGGQAATEKSAALTKKSAQEPLRAQTPLRTQPQLRTPLQASPPAAAPMLAKESAEAADPSDDVSDGVRT